MCAVRASGSVAIGSRASPGLRIAPRRRTGSPTARLPSGSRRSSRLRRLRFTAAEIAETLGMALSTVSGILTRLGAGTARPARARAAATLRALTTRRARAHRRQEARPDRGRRRQTRRRRQPHCNPTRATAPARDATVGWEYVHVAVDDYSRLAYAEVLADEKADNRGRLPPPRPRLLPPPRHPSRTGTHRQRQRLPLRLHALTCRQLGIRHLRTRPYRPQTNGKAERFIRTLLNGWAYGAIYGSSSERTTALDGWLWHYNHRRRHSALGHQPPISRTNLLGSCT